MTQMFDSQDILYAAQVIRPHLARLTEEQIAQQVISQLDNLLERAETGENVENLILELLGQHDSTRRWLKTALVGEEADELKKSFYQPAPGNIGPVSSGILYTCPIPDCDFAWSPRRAGQPIPSCPYHATKLTRQE